MVYVLMNVI